MSTPLKIADPVIRFDGQLMAEDMALRGWTKVDLARRAKCADMTVLRFLRGEFQSNRTAYKLAKALGHSVRRYLISSRPERVAS